MLFYSCAWAAQESIERVICQTSFLRYGVEARFTKNKFLLQTKRKRSARATPMKMLSSIYWNRISSARQLFCGESPVLSALFVASCAAEFSTLHFLLAGASFLFFTTILAGFSFATPNDFNDNSDNLQGNKRNPLIRQAARTAQKVVRAVVVATLSCYMQRCGFL